MTFFVVVVFLAFACLPYPRNLKLKMIKINKNKLEFIILICGAVVSGSFT